MNLNNSEKLEKGIINLPSSPIIYEKKFKLNLKMKFMKVIIIAEAGVNHNGSLAIAKKLVDAAKLAKADYVKFQTFSPNQLVIKILQKQNTKEIFITLKKINLKCLKD